MIEITFPDGAVKEYKKGITPIEIARSISNSLAKNLLSVSFNKKQIESSSILEESGSIEFHFWEDPKGKSAFWHSSAHLFAQIIKELYPKSKLTIGPPIENGFYYDLDLGDQTISENDFEKIEKRIIEEARKDHKFSIRESSKEDAINFYKNNNNEYKIELIENLGDEKITFCDHANFSDLCKGGHIPSTGHIKAVKLLNVAGAYWRGDENNKQLTRVYGISFPKQKLLNEHLELIEEAKKRDHRVLGKKLKLFTFSQQVGLGLPLWLPKGAELRKRLEDFLTKAQKAAGYDMVVSPHIGNKKLYETSGHFQKYGESSFMPIKSPSSDEEFLLKPMNCPHHCEIYKSEQWSYKDLPIRYAEFGTVYRYEQSGELHGLTRVRGFTQDDAHIFCSQDQLVEEFEKVIDLVLYVFNTLGFDNYEVQISLKDKNDDEKYIGSAEMWDLAENAIVKATTAKKLNYTIEYGEAAFYGPKLDFMVKDALNRKWQLGTIQVDYNLPERFDLKFKNKNNQDESPVMIHRAPFGSLERFVAILIEHTGGVFPMWLTSNQIVLISVGEKHEKFAKKVSSLLEKAEIRATLDNRNETVGKKIRESEQNKVPYMGIIGDKEVSSNSVSIRGLGGDEVGEMNIDELINFIKNEEKKSLINN